MPTSDPDKRLNRDEDMKPGDPPRSATEPDGAAGSSQSAKTMTDPVTGEPRPRAPAPNQAQSDETPQD